LSHEKGGVRRGIVKDAHFGQVRAQLDRNPIEHLGQRRRGVVGHDVDHDARLAEDAGFEHRRTVASWSSLR
jgi:hypothetical protein